MKGLCDKTSCVGLRKIDSDAAREVGGPKHGGGEGHGKDRTEVGGGAEVEHGSKVRP